MKIFEFVHIQRSKISFVYLPTQLFSNCANTQSKVVTYIMSICFILLLMYYIVAYCAIALHCVILHYALVLFE